MKIVIEHRKLSQCTYPIQYSQPGTLHISCSQPYKQKIEDCISLNPHTRIKIIRHHTTYLKRIQNKNNTQKEREKIAITIPYCKYFITRHINFNTQRYKEIFVRTLTCNELDSHD